MFLINKTKYKIPNMSSNGGNNTKKTGNATSTGATNAGGNKSASASTGANASTAANKAATNAENLSELMGSNNDTLGFTSGNTPTTNNKSRTTNNTAVKSPNNTTARNQSGKNQSASNSGSMFGDLFAGVSSPVATNNKSANSGATSSPAAALVSTTETAIKSASNKLSEVKETVSDRIGELTSGSDLGMNLLKIALTILILVALFYVAKYLFTRYQDSVYNSPLLLDGIKNSKHALVISQDPANPSYVPMPKSDDQASLEFTYDFWILIDSYEYKKGEWKHVFHKGNSSSYPNRAPGVWLHPDTNAMRIYMNTQDNVLEYVDVDNLPLRKWIHVSLVLHDMDMDVFINGYLKKRQKLTSVPKLNNGDFWVNMFGGFEGYLARIRYYAKAISVDEIAANVRAGPGDSNCIDTGQTPPYLDDDWWSS
jgi:hypothetical protein